jgi:hypothetical protein
VAALPAGTNAIGKLAANSGVDIGDVDVATVPAPLSTTGGGTEATALRVTLANDSTGVVSVDDNGGTLTVDGTVAVTNAGITTIASAVAGTEMQVDIVAALPAGTNAIGKLAANSGVDIGDVDVASVVPGVAATSLGKAEDAAHTTGDVGVMALAVRQDTMAALAGTTGDYIPVTTDANGQARVVVGCPDIVVTVTPTCDTSAYAAGDLIFDSTEVPAAVRVVGGQAVLQSLTIIDISDQGVAFTLLVANAETDFGALNSAPNPDDTEVATVIGWIPVVAADYVDLGASKVACVRNIGLLLQAGAATTSVWVACVNGTGTPTFAVAGLVLQLGLLRS